MGHTMIQKDDIVEILSYKLQRFLAAFSRIYLYSCFFQEVFHNLKVHPCIINHQDMSLLCGKLLMILRMPCRAFEPSFIKITYGFIS